jgi:hypothetical protein
MKNILLLTLIFLFTACGEKVETTQQNIILDAMTNGQWKVTSFRMGSMDHTADFTSYKFQFKTNSTVDALNSGSLEKTGTWQADPAARTISSQFANASSTLTLLNGTWVITDNSWTYVIASQTVNGTVYSLRLDKL